MYVPIGALSGLRPAQRWIEKSIWNGLSHPFIQFCKWYACLNNLFTENSSAHQIQQSRNK